MKITNSQVEIGENIVTLTKRCNQDCVFCSTKGRSPVRANQPDVIKKRILSNKERVSFEGGEPTLTKDLCKWVEFARNNRVKEIILCTNGILLSNNQLAERLHQSGVTLFNVNFPSHNKGLHKTLTKRGFYHLSVKGIENLSSLGLKNTVRLTFIINTLNYTTMRGYVKFLKNFKNVFYVEFNLVKLLGYVLQRKYLVPKLSEFVPYLLEAMAFARENKLRVITDGVPLCMMMPFPEFNIDVLKFVSRGYTTYKEKTKTKRCSDCYLRHLCGGIRKDYAQIHGDAELQPVFENPLKFIQAVKEKGCL